MPTYSITPLPNVSWNPSTVPANTNLNLNVPNAASGHGWSILRFRMTATLTTRGVPSSLDTCEWRDFFAREPSFRIIVDLGSGTGLSWVFFATPSGTCGTYTISGEASGSGYTFRDWRKNEGSCSDVTWQFQIRPTGPGFNDPNAYLTLTVTLLEVDVQDIGDSHPDCTVDGSFKFIGAAEMRITAPSLATTIGPIEADSEKGRYYVGVGQVVKIYHAHDWTVARESIAHSNVDSWKRFRYDPRYSILLMLGKQGGNYKVCRSPDGGQTQTEILSVTANSAGIERDSENGQFLFFYTDAIDKLFLRRSKDGGLTFDTAEQVKDTAGSQLTGSIIDFAHNPRVPAICMTFSAAGSTGVYQSTDEGKTFALKVS